MISQRCFWTILFPAVWNWTLNKQKITTNILGTSFALLLIFFFFFGYSFPRDSSFVSFSSNSKIRSESCWIILRLSWREECFINGLVQFELIFEFSWRPPQACYIFRESGVGEKWLPELSIWQNIMYFRKCIER